MSARQDPARNEPNFSIGKLAIASLGAGTAVLVLTVLVIFALQPAPAVGLVVAFGGLVGSIAAMAAVSKWVTRRFLDRVEAAEAVQAELRAGLADGASRSAEPLGEPGQPGSPDGSQKP